MSQIEHVTIAWMTDSWTVTESWARRAASSYPVRSGGSHRLLSVDARGACRGDACTDQRLRSTAIYFSRKSWTLAAGLPSGASSSLLPA